MDVLISWVGFHDPFGGTPTSGPEDGPVLTALAEGRFPVCHLLTNPGVSEQTARLTAEIARRHPDVRIETHMLPLADPTDYNEVWEVTAHACQEIVAAEQKRDPSARFVVSISSGTPQMQTIWFLLVASRVLLARLVQVRRPQHARDGQRLEEIPLPEKLPKVEVVSSGENEDALVQRQLERLMAELQAKYKEDPMDDLEVTGQSREIRRVRLQVRRMAEGDDIVLIVGETGTGKELVARALHRLSPRAKGPFIPVNCSAIPESLAERELFGHVKGSFTGAVSDQPGYWQQAQGGTLFLDEIGDLPLSIQPKLLRAIQFGQVQPVGGKLEEIKNVRLILATNRNLEQMVREGKFREDLWHRIRTFVIEMPPLRERPGDIPLLIDALLPKFARGRKLYLSHEVTSALCRYDWPGNVRELEECLRYAANMCTGTWVEMHHLPPDILRYTTSRRRRSLSSVTLPVTFDPDRMSWKEVHEELDRVLMERMLRETGDNAAEVARRLGVSEGKVRNDRKRWWPDHRERFGRGSA